MPFFFPSPNKGVFEFEIELKIEGEMDYNLAALKLFCGQLKDASPVISSSPSAMTLGPILFQRAWLQGVLVSGLEEGHFILDDGSDIVELSLPNELRPQDWKKGMYVMVIGVYVINTSDPPLIKDEAYQN
ncbi:recQ-mediated instability-like protein isoform X2 [Tasmannia lanceolata]|uniref:recQ-mediated instability-like protein isoform X2 n=1 Tax=Tasmannia lanceolata TaxID=3420 RepID=UPI004063D8A5